MTKKSYNEIVEKRENIIEKYFNKKKIARRESSKYEPDKIVWTKTQQRAAYISVLIIILSLAWLLGGKDAVITGYATRSFTETTTDLVNQTYNSTFDYTFTPIYEGDLESLSVSGEVIGSGQVIITLVTEDENYTIYDSGEGEPTEGFEIVTANAPREAPPGQSEDPPGERVGQQEEQEEAEQAQDIVEEPVVEEDEPIEEPVEDDTEIEEGAEDEPDVEETIEEVDEEIPLDETNQTLNLTEPEPPANLTDETEENETEEETVDPYYPVDEERRQITIDLKYNPGTAWDPNNDGIEENQGVVDLTVEDTAFNWDVNEDHLCTRWGIYSEEDALLTSVCYGSDDCCTFVGIGAREGFEWDDPLDVYIGRYGATDNNIILAEVMYGYFNLDPNDPVADFIFSDQENLTTTFIPAAPTREFEAECGEGCLLNLNQTNYTIHFEIHNASLLLTNVSYSIEAKQLRGKSREAHLRNALRKNIEFEDNAKIESMFLEEDHVRIIVKKKGTQSIGGETLDGLDTYEVKVMDLFDFASLDESMIEKIALDEVFYPLLNASMDLIDANMSAYNLTLDGNGQTICMIDTGVNYSHQDIVNYFDGYDFVNNDTDPMDDHGHGTAIAGVISKFAPGADLVVAKVLNATGQGYQSDVLEGMQWCMDVGADVISISIGTGSYSGYCDSNMVAELVNEAVANGIVVVAATGNDGNNSIRAPSCAMNATRVSATDKSSNIASFSNVNLITDLFAPGKDVITTDIEGGYVTTYGTSISAPMVAASAALMLENETIDPLNLKYRFRSTGNPIEYTENEVTINISQISLYNALINNLTMIPYNYSANESNVTEEEEPIYEMLFTGGTYLLNSTGTTAYYIDTTVNVDGIRPPFAPGYASYTEYNADDYNNATIADNLRNAWVRDTPDELSTSFVNLWYNFSIDDEAGDVGQINFTWHGYNDYVSTNFDNDFAVYFRNVSDDSWDRIYLNETDQTSQYNFTLKFDSDTYNMSHFIDSNSNIQFGIIGDGETAGLGGLCFMPDTPISMSDGSFKSIKDVVPGDMVKVYDQYSGMFKDAPVHMMMTRMHSDVFNLIFEDGTLLQPTSNHPFMTLRKGWASVSGKDEMGLIINKLEIGDKVIKLGDEGQKIDLKVTGISAHQGEYLTYNLVNMKHGTYLASGIVTHNTCFTPETPISMGDGSFKRIKDVNIGDLVKVFNPETWEIETAPVTEIQEAMHDNINELHLSNGKILKPTAHHPFLTKNKSWATISGQDELGVGAGKIEIGDTVYSLKQGGGFEEVNVTAIVPIEGDFLTYNFINMKYETFIADDIVVHNSPTCFAAGTMITLHDGSVKPIEDIEVGDSIRSWDFEKQQYVDAIVSSTWAGLHDRIYSINNMINVTPEHPFWTLEHGWAALEPDETLQNHGWKPNKLEIGMHLMNSEGVFIEVTSLEEHTGEFMTYNLQDVEEYNNYFAQGMLVHNKYSAYLYSIIDDEEYFELRTLAVFALPGDRESRVVNDRMFKENDGYSFLNLKYPSNKIKLDIPPHEIDYIDYVGLRVIDTPICSERKCDETSIVTDLKLVQASEGYADLIKADQEHFVLDGQTRHPHVLFMTFEGIPEPVEGYERVVQFVEKGYYEPFAGASMWHDISPYNDPKWKEWLETNDRFYQAQKIIETQKLNHLLNQGEHSDQFEEYMKSRDFAGFLSPSLMRLGLADAPLTSNPCQDCEEISSRENPIKVAAQKPVMTVTREDNGIDSLDWIRLKVTEEIDPHSSAYETLTLANHNFVTYATTYYLYPRWISDGELEAIQLKDGKTILINDEHPQYMIEFERLPQLDEGYKRLIEIEGVGKKSATLSVGGAEVCQTKVIHNTLYEDYVELSIGPVPDSPPTHSDPDLTPDPAYATSNLTCINQSTSDSNGDSVTNAFSWRKDGDPIMVLHMPFDVNISDDEPFAIQDYSGHENNGTVDNSSGSALLPQWVNGISGGAYNFSVYGFIEVNDTDDTLDINESITVSAWVKTTDSQGGVVSRYHNLGIWGFRIYLASGRAYWQVGNYDLSMSTSTFWATAINDDQWTHIVGTYDMEYVRLYVNGSLKHSEAQTQPLGFGNSPICIGSDRYNCYLTYGTDYDWLAGVIDDVRVYNISMTPDQVQQLFEETKDGYSNYSMIVANLTSANENWTCEVTPITELANGTTKSDWVMVQDATSSCGTLIVDTVLLNNVSADGTCYDIAAHNIELDCAGYTIEYDNASISLAYGVNVSAYDNITVKNCYIQEGNAATTLGAAIRSAGDGGNFSNNTINVTGSKGDSIFIEGDHNVAHNNIIFSAYGIRVMGSGSYNEIFENTENVTLYGALISSTGSSNIIHDNNIDATSFAIYNNGSTNTTIYRNNLTGDYLIIYSTGGAEYGRIYQNTMYVGGLDDYALSVSSSNHQQIFNNTLIAGGAQGIGLLLSQSSNISAHWNNITTNNTNSRCVYLSDVQNSTFHDNWLNASGQTGYYFDGGAGAVSDNIFYNETIVGYPSDAQILLVQNSYNNTFINSSFNVSSIQAATTSNLTVQYHVRVGVSNETVMIGGATVNITNVEGNSVYDGQTTSGSINFNWTYMVVNTTANTTFNNHTINVTHSQHYPNVTSINITPSGQYISIKLYPTNKKPSSTAVLSPDPAYVNDNLVCTNSSTTDPEGDDVTNIFNWKKNGETITLLNMPMEINTSSNMTGAVHDYSGLTNNGTLGQGHDSYKPEYVPGKVGGAYNFSGNDSISLGTGLSELDGVSEFAISMWIRPETIPFSDHQGIFGRGSTGQRSPWIWGVDSDTDIAVQFETTSVSDCDLQSNGALAADTWYNVVLTWNNTLCELYINGEQNVTDATTANPLAASDGAHWIGAFNYSSTTSFFEGIIDEFIVYNMSLTSVQISQMYNDTKDGYTDSRTIVADETAVGDTWLCAITPNDAENDGTSTTDSVTIANKPPEMNTSRISPAGSATPSQDLLGYCNATDADGENVTYYYEWYVNGTLNASGTYYQAYWDYQETADESDCSGDWNTTDGPCANTTDGDWDTAGFVIAAVSGDMNDAYVYENFTKPAGAITGSVFQFRYDSGFGLEYDNNTMSSFSSCWSQSPLQFRGLSRSDNDELQMDSVYGHCWTGTTWTSMLAGINAFEFYEAGMYWSIDNSTTFDQGVEINIANISSSQTIEGQNWTFSCRAYNSGGNSTWMNSSVTVVSAPAGPQCGTISSDTTLESNISSTGTCFTVAANDITLDCNGSKITYATGDGAGYGVNISGYNGTTIKNCLIEHGAAGSTANYAISIKGISKDFNITNNTIVAMGAGRGILLNNSISNVTIHVSDINVTSANAIYIHSNVSNVTIKENEFNSTSGYAIYGMTVFYDSLIIYNNFSSYNGMGVYGNTNISGLTIQSNNFTGLTSNDGISLTSNVFNNIIESNTFNTYSDEAIYMATNVYNNTIRYNHFNMSSDEAVYLTTTVYNNSIYGNTVNASNSGVSVFYLTSAAYNNSIYENNISVSDNSNGQAIYLVTNAYFNYIYDNVIHGSNSAYGVRIGSTCYNNSIYRNDINTYLQSAIYLSASPNYNNLIYENELYSNLDYVLFMSGSNSTYIYQNNITNEGNQIYSVGIFLYNSNYHNVFDYNRISCTEECIALHPGSGENYNNVFKNIIITNGTAININSSGDSYNNTFLNMTFNRSSIIWGTGGDNNLTLQWYLRINVTDSAGNPIEGASVNITDNNSNYLLYGESDGSGLSAWVEATEMTMNKTINRSFNDYIITVNRSSYATNATTLTLTESQTFNLILYSGDTEPTITWTLPADDNSSTFDQNFTQSIQFADDSALYILNCSIYSDAAQTDRVWSYQYNISGNETYTKTNVVYTASWLAGVYYENCTITDEN